MDNFDKTLLAGVLLFVTSVVVGITSYAIHKDNLIAEAIRNGNDPIKVRIAFEASDDANHVLKGVYLSGKQEEK